MTKTHEVTPEERRRMQAEMQQEQPSGYTLADYERAKADLAAAEERWDHYTGKPEQMAEGTECSSLAPAGNRDLLETPR